MYPERNPYLSDDIIHPNEDGRKLLGTQVADAIKECGIYKNKVNKDKYRQEINREEKTIQLRCKGDFYYEFYVSSLSIRRSECSK